MDLLFFINNGVFFKNKNNGDVDLTKNNILRFRNKHINKIEPVSFWKQTGLVSTGDPKLISGKEACKNFSNMTTCDRCGAFIPAYHRDTLCKKCLEEIESLVGVSSLDQIKKSEQNVKRLEKDRAWFLDI